MTDKVTFAWRSILLQLAGKLKQGEPQKIAFLADLPDSFRTSEVGGEDVLERLQMNGVFSPSSPQGLFDIFTDLGRKDLAKQAKERVKDFQTKYGNGTAVSGSSCNCGRLEVELRSALMHMGAAEDHLNKLSPGPTHLLISESLRMNIEIGLEHLKQLIRHFQVLHKSVETTMAPSNASDSQQDPGKESSDIAIYATLSEFSQQPPAVSVVTKPMYPYTSRPLPQQPTPPTCSNTNTPPLTISRPLPEQPPTNHNGTDSPLTISRPFQESTYVENGYENMAALHDDDPTISLSTSSADSSPDNQDTVIIYTRPQEEDIIEKHNYSDESSPEDRPLLLKTSVSGPVYEHVDSALASATEQHQHNMAMTVPKKLQAPNINNSSFSRSTGIRSPVRKGTVSAVQQQQLYATIKNEVNQNDRQSNNEDEEDSYCTFIKRDSLLIKEDTDFLDVSGGHDLIATIPT